MIDTIFFDWGSALIENPTPAFTKSISLKLEISQQQFIDTYKLFSYRFERGMIEENDMWIGFSRELNIEIEPSGTSLWYEAFSEIYIPQDKVFKIASNLSQNGYKIGLLSNTEIPAMNFFLEKNYLMLTNNIFSCAEGYAKPDYELYQIALTKMKSGADKSLFIDDKPENIKAAAHLGINTIHFENYSQFISDLNSFSLHY